MGAKDPSYAPTGVTADDLKAERACFHGTLLAALAFGALLMLYVQLTQVLLVRPKRGQTFWAIVAYSGALFPLAVLSISVMFKFSEMSYIENRNYPGGPTAFYRDYSSDYVNVIGQVSETLFPWFADILMISRLLVVWNYKWWIAAFPAVTYLTKLGISIPVLISQLRPRDPTWLARAGAFGTSYYSVTMAFNIYITVMICIRLQSMRRDLETVTGRLHASFYTSSFTMIVESGVFFTVWVTVYLIMRSRGSLFQNVFLLPIAFTLGITRMLIVLRIAQDRAWSKDLVTATDRGVLDWQVSSTHSVPLRDNPASSMTSFSNKGVLPRKFQGDSIVLNQM
ncbi:hypothetical protein Hypma_009503 [Hypsizygus marmoreus]|uniref:Uncharacterized protein n=1 Tax=Hypsizygus marmoreus TaxID=39966 RepID=A0A369JVD6_HYPMA|nr:hypothetical protein Hypma_009503 [Hypsizygus marmoreus]